MAQIAQWLSVAVIVVAPACSSSSSTPGSSGDGGPHAGGATSGAAGTTGAGGGASSSGGAPHAGGSTSTASGGGASVDAGAACAKYCECMSANCSDKVFTGGCLSACAAETNWDLKCRQTMCTLVPAQPNNDHCTHAFGVQQCLDK